MAAFGHGYSLAIVALGWHCLTWAEEPAVSLPPVTVPVPPPEPAESPSRRDPTGAITVIDAQAQRGEAKEASDLLAPVPGVLIQDSGGFGQAKFLSLRGASSNGVLVSIDGIPLNGPGGIADLALIPAAVVEKIEVLRGAAGARYGSGGLGGTINVVTRSPANNPSLSAELGGGSFGTYSGAVSGNAPLGQDAAALILVHGLSSEGNFSYPFNPTPQLPGSAPVTRVRQNNQSRLGGALAKYRHGLSPRTNLDALLEIASESRGLAGTVDNPTSDARQSNLRTAVAARLRHQWPSGLELSGRAYLRRDTINLTNVVLSAPNQTHLVTGGEVSASMPWASHALSLVLQFKREALAAASQNPSRFEFGALAWDEISIGPSLTLVPSMRFDQVGHFATVSPKLGAAFALARGWELRGNVGQAFRAPSFLELYISDGRLLPNGDLRPERTTYADGQIAYASNSASASVGGFYSRYEDLISYEYYPPLLARAYNLSSAQAFGLESEATANPISTATLSAAYTLLFSHNLREDPRYYAKELPYRPRHRLHLRAGVGPPEIRGQVELEFQSTQYINRSQTLSLPDRTFVNAGLSSRMMRSPEMRIFIEMKNVFDIHTQDFDGYPLPGRGVYASVVLTLEKSHSNEVKP